MKNITLVIPAKYEKNSLPIVLKELENSKAQNHDVNELLVKFTILHGELMSAINKARNPAGEKGNLISAAEKKEIFDAFHALENKILKIKTTIESNLNIRKTIEKTMGSR